MSPKSRLPALRFPLRGALALVPVGGLLLAGPAGAQDADFLFERPTVSVGLFGGYAVPRAQSDIFEFTGEELMTRGPSTGTGRPVEGSDFRGLALGGEISVLLTERLDLALTASYSGSEVESELQEFVEETDQGDLPILQTTEFKRIPVTLSVKGYLWERGRSVSRFAWVPVTRWSPYLGAGAGWVWYSFIQEGDFVDYQTPDLEIFTARVVAEESAPTFHVLAGAQVYLGPRLVLTGEGRYSWARASMGSDDFEDFFDGFDKIDLSGFQVTAGLGLRF